MELLAWTRQALLFVHALAFAAALSAVLREDFRMLREQRIDPMRLEQTARVAGLALVLLWVTGLGLVLTEAGLVADPTSASPKLMAKILVVLALTLNGLALHRLAFPGLQRAARFGRPVPLVAWGLGAVSSASWLFASFIGLSRVVASALTLGDYLRLYGCVVALAVVIALGPVRWWYEQRRLPASLGAAGSELPPAGAS